MKKIFVTNTGDKKHAEELLERTDLQVTFVIEKRFIDMYPENTHLIIVDNLNDPSASTRSVLEQCDCNSYEAVIALSERAAPTAAYLRDYLGLEGPSFHTVMNCINKFTMKRKFRKQNIPTANFRLASSIEEVSQSGNQLGYPIIVKPIIGAGADATKIFNSSAELDTEESNLFFERLRHPITTSEKEFPVIVESFENVKIELHCDGYVENGKINFVQVSQYLKPIIQYSSGGVYGSFTLQHSDPLAEQVLQMHEQAVQAMGIVHGITHFEVFLTDKGLLAGEIACRPGGGGICKMLQLYRGFHTWDAHIKVFLGEPYAYDKNIESENNYQILELMLPTKRGHITSISSAKDFENLVGLIEVDMKVSVGETIDGLLDSSAVSGILYIRIDKDNSVEKVIDAVENIFIIETEEDSLTNINL